MAAQQRQSTRARYGWALKLPDEALRRLTPEGSAGLTYMQDLAENADERRRLAPTGRAPKPLTVTALALEDRCSRREIYRLMKQARIELFGKDLSDSAIYYRLRRHEQHGDPAQRPCAHQGCIRPLPRHSTVRRRYCYFHLAGHARTARHREQQRQVAGTRPD